VEEEEKEEEEVKNTTFLLSLVLVPGQPTARSEYILFSVVFTPSSPKPPRQCLAPSCHLFTFKHCGLV
jgi:hypothetical protein